MAEQCFHIHHKVSLYTHNFKVECVRFSPLPVLKLLSFNYLSAPFCPAVNNIAFITRAAVTIKLNIICSMILKK